MERIETQITRVVADEEVCDNRRHLRFLFPPEAGVRKSPRVALFVMGMVAARLFAQEGTEPPNPARAIVDKAVKAQGGEAKAAKRRVMRVRITGVAHLPDVGDVAFTLENHWQLPKQYKSEMRFDYNGTPVVRTIVINGEQGWMSVNGVVTPTPDKELAEAKEQMYAEMLDKLINVKDKAYELSLLEDIKIDNRPASGVRVVSKGRRDVKLYFDQKTGFLVKMEHEVRDLDGKLVPQEAVFRDHRDFAGVKLARRLSVTTNGRRTLEGEISQVWFFDKLEDKVFAKP